MRAKTIITFTSLAALAVLAACSPKPTADTVSSTSAESPAAMSDMGGMSGMTMDSMAKTGQGVGTITAIDTAAGTLTIDHQAIPAVDWPAMTMSFKANPASMLDGLKVGEKVSFDVRVKGSDAEVTAVRPQ